MTYEQAVKELEEILQSLENQDTSLDDASEKAEYYLTHETERLEIAGNGQKKIKERFRMEQRVGEMLKFLQD